MSMLDGVGFITRAQGDRVWATTALGSQRGVRRIRDTRVSGERSR
jgi:hypothetical protein